MAADTFVASALPRLIESRLLTSDLSQHSERTLDTRRERLGKHVWFLNLQKIQTVGVREIQTVGVHDTQGQSGRRMLEQAESNFLRSEAGGVQKSISQGFGKIVNDNQHDLFKPAVGADRKVGPSTADQTWDAIKDSGVGREIESSAQKAAKFLRIGGKDVGKNLTAQIFLL